MMKKSIRLLAYLSLVAFLAHFAVFANSTTGTLKLESTVSHIYSEAYYGKSFSVNNLIKRTDYFAPLPPVVTSPLYLCRNSTANALTATASTGSTLIWYGTDQFGGVASPAAPIPSTTTVGQTKYYVSQVDGTGESPRAEIVVNVVADSGATILGFVCDPSQVTTTTSVFFDWGNNPLTPGATVNYSYTILGGSSGSGQSTNANTNLEVFGVAPGQLVTLTLTSLVQYPCVPAQTKTCSVPCGASTVTPNFAAISPICSGAAAPVLGPVSPNNISGTWSPALASNTISGNYVFTPDPVAFPCATNQTLAVTIIPLVTPVFASIPVSVCQNTIAPNLPSSSSNATPISGAWSPAAVDTSIPGVFDYIFTPNSGQCVASPNSTVTITVNPRLTPTFTAVAAVCSGASLSALPTTSNNSIAGTWSPALNNTATTTYTFTPTAGQCATIAQLTISVTPNVSPTFTAVSAICAGTTLTPLPITSNNGYSGIWSPALDNTATTIYTFTPNPGQCATTASLTIIVNQLITPNFANVPRAVCENDIAPPLPSNSSNSPVITGTWSPATVDSSIIGTTDYIFSPNSGQCADTETISITVNPANTLVSLQWTVSEAFSENQIITVTASGAGDYLYQLDYGPFQSSPVFENVSAGYHSVTVQDVTGCSASLTRNNILVIGYPKFFTPNNDGFNDNWNIFTLVDQLGSKIQIFDRYGKFLKEIGPDGTGWNGTYNGYPLPSTDYWFVVDYPEDGIIKQFRSHFSLKR